jgi:hypothetical protein
MQHDMTRISLKFFGRQHGCNLGAAAPGDRIWLVCIEPEQCFCGPIICD